jgi:hypothetical protein
VIQRSAASSDVGSSRQVRTRPIFSVRTSPLDSSTFRCWTTAGSDMANGRASSLTDAVPRQTDQLAIAQAQSGSLDVLA